MIFWTRNTIFYVRALTFAKKDDERRGSSIIRHGRRLIWTVDRTRDSGVSIIIGAVRVT